MLRTKLEEDAAKLNRELFYGEQRIFVRFIPKSFRIIHNYSCLTNFRNDAPLSWVRSKGIGDNANPGSTKRITSRKASNICTNYFRVWSLSLHLMEWWRGLIHEEMDRIKPDYTIFIFCRLNSF